MRTPFNKYKKIAAIFFWATIALVIAQLIFVTLPVYELVGNNDPNALSKLYDLQAKANVFQGLIIASFVMSLVFFVLNRFNSAKHNDDSKLQR